MAETVTAVYGSHSAAIQGVDALREEGFRGDQISILAPDPRESEGFGEELGIRVIQAGSLGVATGGLMGGLAGLAGLTGLLIPGAGLILAAGPLAGALVGAIGGATVGGFVGMLMGLGLPKHAAEEYTRALREGRTVVMVHADGEYGLAERALNRARPIGLHHYQERVGAAARSPSPETRADQRLAADPAGQVEVANSDSARSPQDMAAAIEGQETALHDQWLDEAELRPIGGKADTR
ncbi:MAG: hypothetical protein ACO1SX_21860 [Actinomycetota bacterium]